MVRGGSWWLQFYSYVVGCVGHAHAIQTLEPGNKLYGRGGYLAIVSADSDCAWHARLCPHVLILKCYGCTSVHVTPPQPYILFPRLWETHVGRMRCHSPYYVPPISLGRRNQALQTPRILLDGAPAPCTCHVWLHWCAGDSPFHTFYSHALGCAWDALPFSLAGHIQENLLEPPG